MRENRKNLDDQDRDYGFPFVELVPLEIAEPANADVVVAQNEMEQEEKMEEAEALVPAASKLPEVEKVQEPPLQAKKSPDKALDQASKKSSSPMILILLLLAIVILGAMAYFLYYVPNQEQSTSVDASEAVQETINAPITIEEENIQDENAVNEGETQVIEEEEITPTEPELTIIQSRADKPRYFIVVGSVVAERYAMEESKQYLEKGHHTWIVFPYGDIKNFRIAVGKYDNIETATEAWETAKSEFGDAIWILKY
ncbi:hypothetical protein ACFSKL_13945 [Belliella marina]|uniref:SPOR domain-containing protein n=1 Tax=Belliella marina TaxID=1644146 RepID=A0ABW4VP54_9BACT